MIFTVFTLIYILYFEEFLIQDHVDSLLGYMTMILQRLSEQMIQHQACWKMEKGKRNKNETEDIGIQAFDAILQLGVGC